MSDDFDLRNPDTFVAGTVGPPGQRIFFLQATEAGHVVSLKLEKGQVWALANLLSELLEGESYEGPAAAFGELVEPVTAAWTVGRLATGMDTEGKVIVVVADEIDDDDDDPEADTDAAGEISPEDERAGGRARIHLDYATALGFAQQALLLVEKGRDFGMRNGHRPPKT
ncbi:MAG: DUF3090 family protein [Acidimicrobiales bacterium]|nr:DUF3090 family protein [Acidimicrobiales bacterium]MYI08604.1 DUF3090 family protein [Acidimicrobiales bacterium]